MKKNPPSANRNLASIPVIITIFLVGLLFTSCQKERLADGISSGDEISVAQRSAPLPIDPSDKKVIVISHGNCFGQCAVYNTIVTEKGRVIYQGIHNVSVTGTKIFKIPQREVENLQLFMADNGFFTLEDKYPSVPDLPKTETFLSIGERTKNVVDWGVNVPQILPYMRNAVEDKLGITKLVKGPVVSDQILSVQ